MRTRPGTPPNARGRGVTPAHALLTRTAMKHRALLFAMLAACGDDGHALQPDAAAPDASPDAQPCMATRTPDPDASFESLLQSVKPAKGGMGIAILDGTSLVH